MKLKNFQEAHALFKQGKNKTQIANALRISRPTIIQWLQQDDYEENRGWQSGQARKYTDPATAERICELKGNASRKRNTSKAASMFRWIMPNSILTKNFPSCG